MRAEEEEDLDLRHLIGVDGSIHSNVKLCESGLWSSAEIEPFQEIARIHESLFVSCRDDEGDELSCQQSLAVMCLQRQCHMNIPSDAQGPLTLSMEEVATELLYPQTVHELRELRANCETWLVENEASCNMQREASCNEDSCIRTRLLATLQHVRRNAVNHTTDGIMYKSMVPLMDLIPHARDPENALTWRWEPQEKVIVLRAGAGGADPGVRMTRCFADTNNEELMLRNVQTEQDNPYEADCIPNPDPNAPPTASPIPNPNPNADAKIQF